MCAVRSPVEECRSASFKYKQELYAALAARQPEAETGTGKLAIIGSDPACRDTMLQLCKHCFPFTRVHDEAPDLILGSRGGILADMRAAQVPDTGADIDAPLQAQAPVGIRVKVRVLKIRIGTVASANSVTINEFSLGQPYAGTIRKYSRTVSFGFIVCRVPAIQRRFQGCDRA